MATSEWEAFRVEKLESTDSVLLLKRSNHFGVCWIRSGAGDVCIDAMRFPFVRNQLLFLTPYQYVRFECAETIQADRVIFHANFLCVETFHSETGCSGPLFNDPYQLPVVPLSRSAQSGVKSLFGSLFREYLEQGLGYQEALIAYTKLLLIQSARWKGVSPSDSPMPQEFRHPVLGPLKELIEQHYCRLHAPADYADLLHMTPKTLGRCVREQLGTTLTELIRKRVMTHAKWQILHTLRPVKEIAAEVGFQDELYFSRLFKKTTGLSPTAFREYETELRGGSNLSMTSFPTSIPEMPHSPDDARVK